MTNDPRFEHDVLTEFAFLTQATRPRVLYSDYDSAAFGNAQIGIECEQLRLRVTRDRAKSSSSFRLQRLQPTGLMRM